MNYQPAQVEDLHKAGGFICGVKWCLENFDWLTLEVALWFVEILDANDE